MKVLHFRSTSILAGPERYILELARPIQEQGFEMELLALYRRKGALGAISPVLEEAKGRGLAAQQWGDTTWFSSTIVYRLAQKLREEGFSLVHTHDYKTDLLGLLAARLARVRAVATVHLHDLSTRRLRLYRLADLLVLRAFPKVIAVAEALRRELIAAGLPGDRIVTVHNAIDAEAFASDASSRGSKLRQQMGIGAQQPVISTVGRLSPQKGLIDFLRSARRVLSTSPNVRFLIIGDGPARQQLWDLSHYLGIQGAISFLGYQRDIAPFMAMSDVIVMASLWEGFPYVLLEALALARPVVATRVGGIPEIVEDGSSGLLVPPRDPERLAAAILYLLRNPGTAAKLGQQGRERVEREFNVQTMARQTAQVYREVLGR